MTFITGLSGLNAAQNMLSVTGNNLANAKTAGFKESRTEFADVYATSMSGVANTTPGAGVKVANDAQQFSQGNLEFTENSMDLAVTGEGFFVLGENVTNPTTLSYSRDGAFHLDANGYVVNNNGNTLLVYKANDPTDATAGFSTGIRQPVQLNTSQSNPKATTSASIGLNLNSTATAPAAAFSTSNPASYNYMTSVNVYDSLGVSHTVSTYYVKTNTVPGTGAGTGTVWNMYVDMDASGAPSGPTQLLFDTSGNLVAPPPAVAGSNTTNPVSVSFPVTTGATSPLALSLDLTGSTQFSAASSVNTLSQNGYPSGNLVSVAVDDNGIMFARYSNGSSTVLGEVALARFQNPQGLTKLGDTRWAESTSSGMAIFGEAGKGSFGGMHSGALESSNVDMAAEMVKLIVAQQMYQANTQTIQTENTIMQSLMNIR